MYFNFHEARRFKTVNIYQSVRDIKTYSVPSPSDCMIKNLDRAYILISENKKILMAGLKDSPNCGSGSHIWHCNNKPVKVRAKVRVHLKYRR